MIGNEPVEARRPAEREFRRALELDPKSEDVWIIYTWYYLAPMRRLDEAVAATRRLLELDPLSPFLQFRLGFWYYYLARQWDRAIEQYHNALELDPHCWPAHCFLGFTYIQTGKFDDGIRAFETCAQLTGRNPFDLGILGWAYALAGQTGEAQKVLEELQELAQKTYVPPCSFAWIYLGLGEIERCFDWLEKAVDERKGWMPHVHVNPPYDPLRSHPRYQALLQKMNLEP